MDAFKLYAHLLENPSAKKPYEDLRKHYEKKGLDHEARVFAAVITKRFNDVDRISVDQEQRKNY